ncbi:SDR family NAD(P)-dependent oxidoreductase [Nocardioides fonticola]|uniref:SDR family NAD(P)-dependent oxidoreductase n=1 Tax=Nocardioides fonticola TaxID=450363 RepID=A0ABP7XHC1_9ACTN
MAAALDLRGRVVVVTGAGSGMGRSYALEAARRGAVLALADYDPAGLAQTAGLLPAGTTVLTRVLDVSDRDAVEAFAASVDADLGGAHVVINNAGIEGAVLAAEAIPEEVHRRVMAVNFDGVRYGTLAFLPQLRARDRAALVNVSSLFGLIGTPHHSDYCASKFAVRGFTEALAAELVGTGVSVHLVHPGGVATNIARQAGSQAFAAKYLTTAPDDIARLVLDALGTRRTRIVAGHRAPSTFLGSRLLPLWVMTRLVRRDLDAVLD